MNKFEARVRTMSQLPSHNDPTDGLPVSLPGVHASVDLMNVFIDRIGGQQNLPFYNQVFEEFWKENRQTYLTKEYNWRGGRGKVPKDEVIRKGLAFEEFASYVVMDYRLIDRFKQKVLDRQRQMNKTTYRLQFNRRG